jgi:hypothetical protein
MRRRDRSDRTALARTGHLTTARVRPRPNRDPVEGGGRISVQVMSADDPPRSFDPVRCEIYTCTVTTCLCVLVYKNKTPQLDRILFFFFFFFVSLQPNGFVRTTLEENMDIHCSGPENGAVLYNRGRVRSNSSNQVRCIVHITGACSTAVMDDIILLKTLNVLERMTKGRGNEKRSSSDVTYLNYIMHCVNINNFVYRSAITP